jgi:very-short-patch-repair endonuclease
MPTVWKRSVSLADLQTTEACQGQPGVFNGRGTRGWTVLRIWQHELKRANERRLLNRLRRAGLEARLALQG